jgi:hypothetical protein
VAAAGLGAGGEGIETMKSGASRTAVLFLAALAVCELASSIAFFVAALIVIGIGGAGIAIAHIVGIFPES